MTAVRRPPGPDPEVLLEAATGAFRERDTFGRITPSPAWADLAPAQREALFERQLIARALERAHDPQGLSATGRAVAERIMGIAQLGPDE